MSAGHTSKVSPLLNKIRAMIARAPCGAMDIMNAFNLDRATAGRIIGELVRNKFIVAIGNANQAGRKDLNRSAVIYAKYGTPLLPPTPGMKRGKPGPKPKRGLRRAPGSGVVPETWYVAPFKPLQRDPFAAAKLSLAAGGRA